MKAENCWMNSAAVSCSTKADGCSTMKAENCWMNSAAVSCSTKADGYWKMRRAWLELVQSEFSCVFYEQQAYGGDGLQRH